MAARKGFVQLATLKNKNVYLKSILYNKSAPHSTVLPVNGSLLTPKPQTIAHRVRNSWSDASASNLRQSYLCIDQVQEDGGRR